MASAPGTTATPAARPLPPSAREAKPAAAAAPHPTTAANAIAKPSAQPSVPRAASAQTTAPRVAARAVARQETPTHRELPRVLAAGPAPATAARTAPVTGVNERAPIATVTRPVTATSTPVATASKPVAAIPTQAVARTAPVAAAVVAPAPLTAALATTALPPPLPITKPNAPPPLPVAYRAPAIVTAPRFQPALSRNDELDLSMFDGAARRRRLQWAFALLALLGVAAAVAATVASHFRPM